MLEKTEQSRVRGWAEWGSGKGAWAVTLNKVMGRDFMKKVTTEQSLGGGESQQMVGQESTRQREQPV